jgi:hypothetical protein
MAAACSISPAAFAQGEPIKDPVAAEALFQEGKAAMADGRLDEACSKFAASMAAEASAGTLLNLARCHQEQGKLATAWAEYKRSAPMFRARGEPKREQAARQLALDLEPMLSRLTIVVDGQTPGLVVRRDGEPVIASLLGTAIPVDPGTYTIEAEAPGYYPHSTQIEVLANADSKSVTIPALEIDPNAPAPGSAQPGDGALAPSTQEGLSTQTILGIGFTGAGAIALTVGGILGVTVLGDASEAEDDPTLCPAKMCTPEGRATIDSAEGRALASTILIGVGAAAAVGGVILILTAPSSEPAIEVGAMRVRAGGSPAGGAVWLDGSF